MTTTTEPSDLAAPPSRRVRPAEASGLGRLAGACYDRRRLVLLLWVLVLVGITVVAQMVGSRFQDNFSGGNSPSQQVQDLLAKNFPAEAGSPAQVVIHTTGPVTSPANRATTASLVAALRPLPHVSGVVSPFSPAGAHQVSPDGHIAFAQVQFDEQTGNLSTSAVNDVINRAKSFDRPGYQVALGGSPIGLVVHAVPGSSEGIGITAAMLIMLLAFGSVVAMGLPIITALFGIAIGFGVEYLISRVLNVPTFGPELMVMIGLGVGIDYALFVVTRYRQGLAEGREPREAATVSLATAGRAVLFAGTTVILSLLGLFILNLPFMRGMAFGAIAAVVLVMAASMTLLPALLGFAGRAIDKLHVPGLLQSGTPGRPGSFWFRWSRTVQRHPVVTGTSALLVLLLLAIPLFSMRLAFTDAGNDPPNLTTRQAFDLLAEGFGPGFNGPLVLAAELPRSGGQQAVQELATRLGHTPGVAFATPPRYNATGDTAVVLAYPTTAPQAAPTETLVQHLRSDVVPRVTEGTGVRVLVGGETAAGIDAAAYLSSRLFLVIGVVILLAFLLLMAVFRSLVIPLKAAVMNLLSVAAAYGVIVAIFQWGWAGSVFAIGSTGPIDPWIPLMMFTILFGLSMDYEVFLLSRIREEWRRTGDNSLAVADGLAGTARVITAAAAIMICVFGSFVIGDPLRVLKVFGFGLAVSILIDATLVRMVLVPSVMELLGPSNWWFPRSLDRIVPHLGVEVDVDGAPAVGGTDGAGIGQDDGRGGEREPGRAASGAAAPGGREPS
ncbi:MAG TPA: MMPL family transporter [Acidimicrobiales bacterium]|nr:MMPL family transporter [Acidimicrobiales bacterium]